MKGKAMNDFDLKWEMGVYAGQSVHSLAKENHDLLEKLEASNEALKAALPWLVRLGDFIGNGSPKDPDGRCNAIMGIHNALSMVGKDVGNTLPE